MPATITMPQLSDTMSEGTLIKWYKKVGDSIKGGEEIADIETDKATMPLETFDEQAGTIAAILVKEGQKVKVGETIALIATKGEKVEDVAKSAGAASEREPSGSAAGAAGHEPDALPMMLQVNGNVTAEAVDERGPLLGSPRQVAQAQAHLLRMAG